MDGERYILVRQRRQSSLGHEVFAAFQDLAGEPPQKKSQGLLLGFFVRKSNHDRGSYPFENAPNCILSHAACCGLGVVFWMLIWETVIWDMLTRASTPTWRAERSV